MPGKPTLVLGHSRKNIFFLNFELNVLCFGLAHYLLSLGTDKKVCTCVEKEATSIVQFGVSGKLITVIGLDTR